MRPAPNPKAQDPYGHLQYGAEALGLREAHALATGHGVEVALIDTGLDIDHPDLADRVGVARSFVARRGVGFTQDVHGTALAGVIAANRDNGEGILGVAPEASLLALKACWSKRDGSSEAQCDSYTLALALDFAIVRGVAVINLSLAGPDDPLLRALVERAVELGIVVVAAREHDHGSGGGGADFPASVPGVLAVSSVGPEGAPRTPASPPKTSSALLHAPGVDVLTTVPKAAYDFLSGSSLAAAHVSGVAALLLERRPGLPSAQIHELLLDTATPKDERLVVHACSALARLLALEAAACEPAAEAIGATTERDSS